MADIRLADIRARAREVTLDAWTLRGRFVQRICKCLIIKKKIMNFSSREGCQVSNALDALSRCYLYKVPPSVRSVQCFFTSRARARVILG